MKMSKSLEVIVLLIVISMVSIGCSSSNVNLKSDADGKGSVTVTSDNGKKMVMSSEAELPKGFPSEIPIPEGVVITASMSSESSGNITVSIEVVKPFEEVVKLYQDYADSAGYQEVIKQEDEGYYMFSGKKDKEMFVFTLGLDQEDNKTVTGALVYEKKP